MPTRAAEAMVEESGKTGDAWQRWFTYRDPVDRAALCKRYTGFARMLAAKCYSHRISQELEFADYLQFAMVGLLEAIDRFSPEFEVKFETFAGHRVNGAILNGVESLSEVQKQLSVRRRLVRERTSSLAQSDGPGPAKKDKESALERLAKVAIGLAIGFALEDTGMYAGEEQQAPDNAYSRSELRQFRERLGCLVESLSHQERTVIHRHYLQQQSFEEIAQVLTLTKGRISQIHRAALAGLRTRVQSS